MAEDADAGNVRTVSGWLGGESGTTACWIQLLAARWGETGGELFPPGGSSWGGDGDGDHDERALAMLLLSSLCSRLVFTLAVDPSRGCSDGVVVRAVRAVLGRRCGGGVGMPAWGSELTTSRDNAIRRSAWPPSVTPAMWGPGLRRLPTGGG